MADHQKSGCEVTDMFKQYMKKLNRTDLPLTCLFFCGLFLVFLVISGVLAFFLKDDVFAGHAFPMFIPPVLMVCGAVYLFLISMFGLQNAFDLHLSFSLTRKNALKLIGGWSLLLWALSSALGVVLTLLDKLLTPRRLMAITGLDVFRVLPLDQAEGMAQSGVLTLGTIMPGLWIFPVLFAAAALWGLIAGTLIRRFGGKAGWTMYLIFMACLIYSNRTDSFLLSILPWMIPALAVLTVLGLILSVRHLLRTPIRV